MKKVVIAAFLTCAVSASGLPSLANAQAAPSPAPAPSQGGAPAPGGAGKVTMSDAEYSAYNNAMTQTNPQAKAAAIEAYLQAYPNSSVKLDTMLVLMQTYAQVNDTAKALDAADRVLQLDPTNLRALTFEAFLRKAGADSQTDAAAKQTALDTAAGYAQKGLTAPKPQGMSDDDFKKLKDTAFPVFYSVIGADDLGKKDTAGAIDSFKKELSSVPIAQTQAPGPQLQDTYLLALAYLQSTPPDYLSCAFYAARFAAYAPEPYKSQVAPTAKWCYKKFHGADDGYDTIGNAAQANLNPPDGLFTSVKPAPTPADIVNQVIASTPDLAALAISDKEFILQNGTPDQASKVWDTIKGKSVQIPDALVIASTPTQLQVAVSDDAKQSKTADFTFNMATPEEPKTAAAKAAFKKQQDAIAAATAVGQTVAVSGTYDSYTPKPFMITMSDGEVVLPKAKAPARAPARRAPARH